MRFLTHPVAKCVLAALLIALVIGGGMFLHYYNKYARIIDVRLSGQIFARPSILFAAPEEVFVGEKIAADDVAAHLRRADYSATQASPVGRYVLNGNSIEIEPGPESFHSPEPALVTFNQGRVTAIADPQTGQSLSRYDLEPEVLTTLFDQHRDKRRLLKYSELPPLLVESVLAIEDKDYFYHGAVYFWRLPAAFYRDVRSGRWEQGGSTITMQVARMFFLSPQKTLRRKLEEALIAFELEQRLTKQQIFELYANQVPLGHHGTYSIRGFGEAADAYFDKDVDQLTLAECALLAGMIQGPNLDNPYRHPARALARRDQVLRSMFRQHDIWLPQLNAALASPLTLSTANLEVSDAPYFVDMVRDEVSDELPESALETQGLHIYTTLDPDLQRAAANAVSEGLRQVDALIRQQRTQRERVGRGFREVVTPGPMAQVALIALDPHTGAIKALIGGRNYAQSQLNHALASRPTGSIFKPFVYAAALDSALTGQAPLITEVSTLDDEPTIFDGDYQPHNFEDKYYGQVPLRVALEHSLNNATIALAQEIGYGRVASVARAAGIPGVLPTPAMAIGSYDATPLAMAGAWTIFANGGVRVSPRLIYSVQTAGGDVLDREPPDPKPVLDPRVAFMTTDLLESVLDHGTGVGVREAGFSAPAAGKTGSSHDGWFAGYTSNLLCVVWVGFDNYQDLNLEGAHSALPIWTAFMKQAIALPAYGNVTGFAPPPGVVAEKIDNESMEIATVLCPVADTVEDYFVVGTQPQETCSLHALPLTPAGMASRVLGIFRPRPKTPPPPPPAIRAATRRDRRVVVPVPQSAPPPPVATAALPKKKRGFFSRLFGLGGDEPKPNPNPHQNR